MCKTLDLRKNLVKDMLGKITKRLQAFADKLTFRHWIILSGVLSVFLGILIFMSVKKAAKPAEEQTVTNVVQVVVAKNDIEAKTIINETMLEMRKLPADAVPADAVKDIKNVVNKPAKVAIFKDDVLSNRKVLQDIKMAGFTGIIPADCRAVSVAISDITGVAGFAQPGNRVDVMLINRKNERMVGRLLLQDIQLLAINKQQEEEKAADGNKDQASTKTQAISKLATATLALTPADILKLVTEAQDATIYLTLRPYLPQEPIVSETVYESFSDPLMDMPSFAPPADLSPAPAYNRPLGNVEVIRGSNVTRE